MSGMLKYDVMKVSVAHCPWMKTVNPPVRRMMVKAMPEIHAAYGWNGDSGCYYVR